MPELMWRDNDSCLFASIFLDQVSHRLLAFGSTVHIHEHTGRTMSDMLGRDVVSIFHQHLCQMRWDVEPNRALVLDCLGIQLKG